MQVLIQILIAVIIAGFVFWIGKKLIAMLPLEPPFNTLADLIVSALAVGIIIFLVVIPLLHLLGSTGLTFPKLG
jgi:hypothetical protein